MGVLVCVYVGVLVCVYVGGGCVGMCVCRRRWVWVYCMFVYHITIHRVILTTLLIHFIVQPQSNPYNHVTHIDHTTTLLTTHNHTPTPTPHGGMQTCPIRFVPTVFSALIRWQRGCRGCGCGCGCVCGCVWCVSVGGCGYECVCVCLWVVPVCEYVC